jgi:predicted NBD/HSP70 family sugar kinase
MDAELKVCEKLSVPLEDVFEELRVEKIIQIINEFIQQKNINRKLIVGIGFSDFIPHDIGTGLKTKSIWMPGWGDINIKAMIEENLKLNTHIMRCTDAFSFAEYAFGSCKGCNAFITAQLEEGIGLSVFKNCNFLKGSTDIFGELGHIVYREDGEICRCGNRGCLETIAGIEAIIKKVQENVEKGAYFKTDRGTEKITFDDIVINALEGNKLALLSINEAAKAIGNTLAVVVNVLGITRIILYGRFIKAGKLISQQVLNSIRQHCIYPLNQDTEVILSSLDEYGSAKGAAYAVLRKYLQNYEIGI